MHNLVGILGMNPPNPKGLGLSGNWIPCTWFYVPQGDSVGLGDLWDSKRIHELRWSIWVYSYSLRLDFMLNSNRVFLHYFSNATRYYLLLLISDGVPALPNQLYNLTNTKSWDHPYSAPNTYHCEAKWGCRYGQQSEVSKGIYGIDMEQVLQPLAKLASTFP